MSRAEQVKTERRRRNTDDLRGIRKRLSINESELDRENFEYYFAKDDPTRLHQLTVLDDWDVVEDRGGKIRTNGDGSGTEVSVLSGTGEGGRPQRSVLLRKRKEHYNDDFAAKQRRIDEIDDAMKRAPTGAAGESTYTPGSRDGNAAPLTVRVER